jgi:putative ABC transport system ATP-binding protein
MPDLSVHELTVAYTSGGYTVKPLDGLSFDVADGTLALLLGPSGCGKTTLLSVLAGILTPAEGVATLGRQPITGLTGASLTSHRRSTVGVVFQAFNLVPSMTATENVAAPLLAAGVRTREARRRADELLDRVGLSHRAHHRPGDLSGGQQQRVAIARALVHDPPLLLADEPTAHLDHVQVEEVLRLLRELAAPGRVVLVSTHDERMLRLADQVVELVPSSAPAPTTEQRLELLPGDVVFTEGSRGQLVYLVADGQIDIVQATPEGDERHLATCGAGDYFGEMGPMFGLPRSATARARTAATVTGYPLDRFRELLGISSLGDLVRRDDRRPRRAKPITTDRRTAASSPDEGPEAVRTRASS